MAEPPPTVAPDLIRGPALVLAAASAVDPVLHRLRLRRESGMGPGSGSGATTWARGPGRRRRAQSGGFGRAQRLLSPSFPPCPNAPLRHARTCSGHPCGRAAEAVEVDARNKSGHDEKKARVPNRGRWYNPNGLDSGLIPAVVDRNRWRSRPQPSPRIGVRGDDMGSGSGATKGDAERAVTGPASAPVTRRNEMCACGRPPPVPASERGSRGGDTGRSLSINPKSMPLLLEAPGPVKAAGDSR